MDKEGGFQFADLLPPSRVVVLLQTIHLLRPRLLAGAGVVQLAVVTAAGTQGRGS